MHPGTNCGVVSYAPSELSPEPGTDWHTGCLVNLNLSKKYMLLEIGQDTQQH